MDAAARLAERARPLSYPNPPVACLLVKEGRVVARGWTGRGGRPHAEAAALEAAGPDARGATLYTTLEPCAHRSERGPTCANLVCEAGLAAVVIGMEDPDPRTAGRGASRIEEAGIAVRHARSKAVRQSLAGYVSRQLRGRPHVTLKLAMSLDGKIALENGESRWITGEVARAHVHARRAGSDAILVGGQTWRTDRPRLDVRLPGLEERSPSRWILTRGAPPADADTIAAPEAIADIPAHTLYVEGGAATAAAFLAADLVDRIDIYRAPIVIGHGRAAIADLGLGTLGEAHGLWTLSEQRQLGSDSYAAYERRREGEDTACSPD